MPREILPKPFPLYILLMLLLALGTGGVYGGFLLTEDPSGGALQIPLYVLEKSPFRDFLLPGIILLIFNGILPLFVAYGLIMRPEWRWPERLNIYRRRRHWAWSFALCCGIILSVWINVQMLLLGPPYSPLQPAFGLYGIVLVVFSLMPKVMRYYERENPEP